MANRMGSFSRWTAVAAVALGILLSLPGAVRAAACGAFDDLEGEARYRLLHLGNPVGEETFRWAVESPGIAVKVTSDAKGQLPGQAFTLSQTLEFDARSSALRSYTLEARLGGQDQLIRVGRVADSLVISIESSQGNLRRAFAEPGDVFILDNLLVNHLAILACRIAHDDFRAETLRVVVPQVAAVVPVTVAPSTPAPDGSRTVEVRIGGIVERLIYDAGGGPNRGPRLAAVEVPSQSLRYERIPDARETPPVSEARRADAAIPTEPAMPTRRLFEERNVQFATGSRQATIDGILTLPLGGQPIPYRAVLLVHAAGPLDRDETIGPNQPFLELARSLAVNGIASLRYDKRTLARPSTIDPATMTVNEEVIEDALAALAYLRSQTEVNGRKIVIVGHDLGGSLAATIARADRRVAGLVILAGTLRPLDELLRDRFATMRDMAMEAGDLSADDRRMYERVFAQLDSLQAGTLPDRSSIEGFTGLYLKDYRKRDRAGDFLAFPGPVLILQGDKDMASRPRDLELWRTTAEQGGKKNVTVREFSGLGHLFIPIPGRPGPMSYLAPGHVDPLVGETISNFVGSIR